MRYEARTAPEGLAPEVDPPKGWRVAGPWRAKGVTHARHPHTLEVMVAVLWERPLVRESKGSS